MSNILGKLKTATEDNNQGYASVAQGMAEKQRNINALKEPMPAPAKQSKTPPMNPKAKYGDKSGEKRMDVNQMLKPLGSFKKGTDRVSKTGIYHVHAGEQVLNKDDAEDMRSGKDRGAAVLSGADKPAMQGSEPDEMHIQKMDDGSFHIKHSAKEGESKQFTARNKKHLVRHIRNTFGQPGEPQSYEDGGIVQKTGPAMLHKNEAVVPNSPDITVGDVQKAKPFVPFGGMPKAKRPSPAQSRDRITKIRNAEQEEEPTNRI